jgi:hypothetical protein
MARTEKYFIGPDLLGDIRRVVGRVDGEPISSAISRIPTRLQDVPRPGNPLQRGTFTHAVWAVGSTMQVTIQGGTNTISVTNYCVPVKGQTNATQTLNVVFGRVMGTVTAVEIQQPTCTLSIGGLDVTELPGFDAEVIQLLGHAEGNTNSTACLGLQWYSVTQCAS